MVAFGILGCGRIAARFAKALEKSDRGTLAACAARDRARAEDFAARFGCRACDSYEALLADPAVEAVYIATVHSAHAALTRAAIGAGKAVLCEKPFFVSAAEGRELAALAREKGVLLMEGFWTRTQPAYQKAVQWLREGKIGAPRLIRAAFCFHLPFNDATRGHRLFDPATAGGALWDAGVYPYQFATGLMGEPPVETRSLVTWAPSGVDLSAGMTLRFRNGVLADLLCSIGGVLDNTGIISGSEGYITLDYIPGPRRAALYTGQNETAELFEDPETEGFVHEIAHFAGLVESGRIESDINPLSLTLDFTERAESILAEARRGAVQDNSHDF
ncbi:MAG: Gfo/Idh/MocA family oxidoreductase [Oscillospiraceae bacterium]|nr:Gfo/Idh/MocA family oxidoreductase [Oscillospiraceae bacterium]